MSSSSSSQNRPSLSLTKTLNYSKSSSNGKNFGNSKEHFRLRIGCEEKWSQRGVFIGVVVVEEGREEERESKREKKKLGL